MVQNFNLVKIMIFEAPSHFGSMKDVYLLIGGNMGDRIANLQQALNEIALRCGTIENISALYETAAWGKTDQPDFLNQVLCIDTGLSPRKLLTSILEIENRMGRFRDVPLGPRTIDIDILFYGQQITRDTGLEIPHPRIAARRFVLTPLNEIAPDFIHPLYNLPISELLRNCVDPLPVNKYNAIVNKKD